MGYNLSISQAIVEKQDQRSERFAVYNHLGKVSNKKTEGGGVTPIPYLFYYWFGKRMGKMMLSNSVFYVPSDVKITLKNPKKNLGNI